MLSFAPVPRLRIEEEPERKLLRNWADTLPIEDIVRIIKSYKRLSK